jgi:two-component system chemotaxis sensor kinase CheA
MDLSQYRELFISEAKGHLAQISDLVVLLEQDPADRETIAALFRSAHSLKGMAATMSYTDIMTVAHRMEDLLDRVRTGAIRFDGEVADLLLAGNDLLTLLLEDIEAERSDARDIAALVTRLTGFEPSPQPERRKPTPAATPAAAAAVPTPPSSTVRVKTQTLDRLIDLSGELLTVRHRFAMHALQHHCPGLPESVHQLSLLLRQLHEEVLAVRMFPIALVTERFPRMLRDLARQTGKELEFSVDGQGLELDRYIIDQLSEPLVHLLRNAVDHGLELPAERLAAGKPAMGTIQLTAARDHDHALITVADDGRGMNPQRLTASAIAKGLIKPEQGARLTTAEALQLICLPGFSTANAVSDISGRGVGMDAVQTMVQQLGGSLIIASTEGEGTRMTLRLPLSVAIIAVLLVTAGPFTFALPVCNVIATMDLHRDQITLRNKRPFIRFMDEDLPLYSLNRLFGVPLQKQFPTTVPLFIAEVRGRKAGFVVDRFLGQQELFVKPLGKPLSELPGIAGGAVLGDGTVVYVLDVPRLT